MAKYCYTKLNGKWYLDTEMQLLKELSKRLKNGEDVSKKVMEVLDRGRDEKPGGDTVEDFLRPGKTTRDQIKADFKKMDMVFNYTKKESISVEEAIERAYKAGLITKDYSAEMNIVTRAISSTDDNPVALNYLEVVALQRAIGVIRDAIYQSKQKLDEMVESGSPTTELADYLEKQKDLFKLFTYAHNLNATNTGRAFKFIGAVDFLAFDPVMEMKRLTAAFPNATDKDIKFFEDLVEKMNQAWSAMINAEIDIDKSMEEAQKAAANKGFNQVKAEAKQKEKPPKEPKVKTFYHEIKSKVVKDPLGTFKSIFRGDYRKKINFQGDDVKTIDNAEDYDRGKAEAILGLVKHLIKEEGIKDLTEMVDRVMEIYEQIPNSEESLTRQDILNALALKSENRKKLPEYTKVLRDMRSARNNMKKISTLLEEKIRAKEQKKKENPKEKDKIQDMIIDLQKMYMLGSDLALTPAQKEKIVQNLEKISEAYRIMRTTGSNEVVKQKANEIRETLIELNGIEEEIKFEQKIKDLEDNGIVDTRKTYIKPFLSNKAFELKEKYEELRTQLKHREMELEYNKAFEKYSDEPFFKTGVSVRSIAKKMAAFKDHKFWWFLATRFRLGLDFGILAIHCGFDHLAMIGKAVNPLSYRTADGRKYMKTNLQGMLNFYRYLFYSFYVGFAKGDQGKDRIVELYTAMKHNPNVTLAVQLGLGINRPFSTQLITKMDDYYMGKGLSDIIEGKTLVSAGVKWVTSRLDAASEGSYVTGLNFFRMNLFQAYRDSHPYATIEELEAIVKEINTTTGIVGGVNVGFANYVLTATRLYFSRVRLILMTAASPALLLSKNASTRAAAKYRLGNALNVAIGFTALVYIMGFLGWEWEKDPRSPAYLKFRKGDETMDLTAGLGKWVAMLMHLLVFKDYQETRGEELNFIFGEPEYDEEGNQRKTIPEFIGRKLFYMLNGTIHAGIGAITGANAIGQPYGIETGSALWGWLVNNYTPVSYSGFIEPEYKIDAEYIRENSLYKDLTESMLSTTGTGFMSYDNNIKHMAVTRYLSSIDVDPTSSFNKKNIEKIFPEVTEAGRRNEAILYQYKQEVNHAVGTRILINLNDINAPLYTKKEIASLFKEEGKRLAEIYKYKYYPEETNLESPQTNEDDYIMNQLMQ